MTIRYKYYLSFILIALLLALNSAAIDTKSKDYGSTHKAIFNDPENCSLCHLYNNFPSELALTNVSSDNSSDDDIYEYEDDSQKSEGGFGWFFGKKKKDASKSNVDVKSNLYYSYVMSGFVNNENIMPHEFIKSVSSICMNQECHTKMELGYSHKVDVSPYDRYPEMQIPGELPLYWDSDRYEEVISCGTCHNPHLDWLSTEQFILSQKLYNMMEGKKYYKTYFVRVRSPELGLFTLCKGCHGEAY